MNRYKVKMELKRLHHLQKRYKGQKLQALRNMGKARSRMARNRVEISNRHITGAGSITYVPIRASEAYHYWYRDFIRIHFKMEANRHTINNIKALLED
jgi:hypothetical protein